MGVVSAGIRTIFIDGTASVLLIEVNAVSVGKPCQSEDPTFFMKSFNHMLFPEFSRHQLEWLPILRRRNKPHSLQIICPNLNLQTAACPTTLPAQFPVVPDPG